MPSTLVALISLLWLISGANAAECTDSEAAYADSVWAAAAATSACSAYVTATDPVYIDAPCTATACVSVVEGVAESLPDCTYSGINNKIEVQNALTACNGGTTTDAGTLTTTAPITTTTDAPIATTASTLAPTSSSTTECTTDEYQTTEDLYDTAAATSACSQYATSSSALVSIYAPCSASDCVAVMTQLAADLPDCLYDGSNEKTELMDSLAICSDDSTSEIDSSTPISPSSGSSSAPTPASTASSTSCTSSEVNNMWDLYVSTAKSDECAADSTINGYSVYIFTECGSDCADQIKDLAESLPNCYYDYELMNKKEDVLNELDGCNDFSSYISITVYPDSSIEFSSSAGSDGTADPSPAGDRITGASTIGVVGSGAATLATTGTLLAWVAMTILAILYA